MTELEELEEMIGSLNNVKALGLEPDFSSLGIEPAEILGFKNDEDLERALIHLMSDKKTEPLFIV